MTRRKKEPPRVKAWDIRFVGYDKKRKHVDSFLGYRDAAVEHAHTVIGRDSSLAKAYIVALDESEIFIFDWDAVYG